MRRRFAVATAIALLIAHAGCHAARVLAPPPPLRAASASDFAVDVEFAEALDRASAEDVAHYTLTPAAGGAPLALLSATLVDTLYGRTVQLLVPGGVPDTTDFDVSASGVVDVEGHALGVRVVRFRSGLSYRAPMGALFDARCDACHTGASPAGNYRTDSLAGLLGTGVDATPDLIAGDPTCLLVRKCKPRNSMFNDANLSYLDYEMIHNWVVGYLARN